MNPILPGAPWLIAHKSMLGINRPQKIALNGIDYVLWQNPEGEVFALNNVCPHLQAPLSQGWICQERNTIVCPFHAQEFNKEGKLYQSNRVSSSPMVEVLDIVCRGDYIWSYGGWEPKVSIPDLIERVSTGFKFVGIVENDSLDGDFLSHLLINYDYNHVKGTHRDLFTLEKFEIYDYQKNGVNLQLKQKIIRAEDSWQELLKNPVALILPKTYVNQLEYSFPSLTSLVGTYPFGKALQINVLYPETEKKTKAFILVFAQAHPLIITLLKNLLLKSVAQLFKQDIDAVKSLYPQAPPRIKLPHEEIMFEAKKLYLNWSQEKFD
ncbi:Rieske (2Fe-2S) protein [Crocosphaera sp. XPORK-15E]|uniref:Rieske (2Fe-2S) protein n=1 Tax=Crocosphaera sp. XPORK-15E TaxID=3110247 RepID=UPI002B210339|nr:Rieske (2Fe-2S) protein [Crocosphaera sp. XPORK-15E]MEA5537358.1 Rieske (2Fe-2S) protein [Crocosphaera sp. XPORK-15E]